MHKKLDKRFAKLAHTRAQLFTNLEGVAESKLNSKPAPDKWSIAQILHHVLTAEEAIIVSIDKKFPRYDTFKPTGFTAAIRVFTLPYVLHIPLKFKAPKGSYANMKDEYTLSELQGRWQTNHDNLHKVLERVKPEYLKKQVIKHPMLGLINISQTMVFFQAHFNHHQKQIIRLLK